MNRVRYTVNDVNNNRFYQMPKFLFEGEFKNLSNDARILYSLLRDRHELSMSNGWINEKGEVYLIFTREDMSELLGCSQPTLRKAIKQLIGAGLMEEERQGANRPNRIYLTVINIKNEKLKNHKKEEEGSPEVDDNNTKMECKKISVGSENNLQSGMKESFSQDCKDFSPNDTDINNTNINDTEYKSISQSINSDEIKTDGQIDNISTHLIEDYKRTIINCELQGIDEKYQVAVAHAIRLLYLDIENKKRINIGDSIIPVEMLKKDMDKLNFFIIEHAVNKFKEASREKEIRNKIGYLKACIYNSIHEMDVDIDSELRYQGLI
ncbi:Replication initiator protein A (RepA) N-terminus [Sporanaerobacter acetigenes DSM 13106]|uniref:Replication initiator protein A (RepA) N-terminus n=2 Tax=Sporanaerobacter acetigenes TaxID=165813 RepID=A0A1M5U6N8_9FIRM|nr:Replication initiator protein A (RepA) N-terminus [Sporanaerobacter acetigenes DSM 13106]